MPETQILIQGTHFDAYEITDKKGTQGNNIEFLCNVTAETFDMVKQKEYVKIDFDGDGLLFWGVIITKKDKANNRLYYHML